LPSCPPVLLYNEYRVIPGVKAAGAWPWPPTPSSAEVKEKVEIYDYAPSGSSWPVRGWPSNLLILWKKLISNILAATEYKMSQ